MHVHAGCPIWRIAFKWAQKLSCPAKRHLSTPQTLSNPEGTQIPAKLFPTLSIARSTTATIPSQTQHVPRLDKGNDTVGAGR